MHGQGFDRRDQLEAMEAQRWILTMPKDPENRCCVAVRGPLRDNVSILHEECSKGRFQGVLADVALAGLGSLVVGSFHIEKEHGDMPVGCRASLLSFFAKVMEHHVDVLGFDCNRGLGPLIDVVRTRPCDEDCGGPKFLLVAPPEFNVGLVLPKGSRLLGMRLQSLVSYAPVVSDIGLRTGDTDWHQMVLAHWVRADTTIGARLRDPETHAKRKRRHKRASRGPDPAEPRSCSTSVGSAG